MDVDLFLRIKDMASGRIEYHKPSRSFVLQFSQLLCLLFKNAAYAGNIKDTGGNNRTGALIDGSGGNCIRANGGPGTVNKGIVVGRANTAESINDFVLGTICNHGVGANNILYGITEFRMEVNDPPGTMTFILEREIANGSGGAITLEEVGLYLAQHTAAVYYFCAIRDVTGGIVINDGESKLIQYVIQVTN